jgi:hypothetical protein
VDIELFGFVTALALVVVSALGALLDDHGPRKRSLIVLSCVLGLLAAGLAFEENARQEGLARYRAHLTREWQLIQDTPIENIQFEVAVIDGAAPIPDIAQALGTMSYGADGWTVSSQLDRSKPAAAAVLEKIGQGGLVGRPLGDVSLNLRTKVARIKKVSCVSSAYDTGLVTHDPAAHAKDWACAMALQFPVSDRQLTLRKIFEARKVETSWSPPTGGDCRGPCAGLLLSVRAVLPGNADGVLPLLVDLSPSVYEHRPTSADGGAIRYAMAGQVLGKLAEDNFMDSNGERDREHFVISRGFVAGIFRRLTTHTETARIVDVVWSTRRGLSDNLLEQAIAPGERDRATPYNAEEWCSASETRFCWFRYVMVQPGKPRPK